MNEELKELVGKESDYVETVRRQLNLPDNDDGIAVALFVAVKIGRVEVSPEDEKKIKTFMENLIDTGFLDGKMNAGMSEEEMLADL